MSRNAKRSIRQEGEFGNLEGMPDEIRKKAEAYIKNLPKNALDKTPCTICGKVGGDEAEFVVLHEARYEKTLGFCFDCATGIITSVLLMLPEYQQRVVIREFVMNNNRLDFDAIEGQMARVMSSIYAMATPSVAAKSGSSPLKRDGMNA